MSPCSASSLTVLSGLGDDERPPLMKRADAGLFNTFHNNENSHDNNISFLKRIHENKEITVPSRVAA